ncbi:hypothetical protein BX666DRAFT_1449784 [Dichotomocladium elegans]|nr:hypothetical protein BX666DRAFT_1449784 [Dichotomocladium elegans]
MSMRPLPVLLQVLHHSWVCSAFGPKGGCQHTLLWQRNYFKDQRGKRQVPSLAPMCIFNNENKRSGYLGRISVLLSQQKRREYDTRRSRSHITSPDLSWGTGLH